MLRRNFRKSSGVILDVCSEHGTWLDDDELEQITGFILSGGAPSPVLAEPPPRPRNEARASAEFVRIRARHQAPYEIGPSDLAGGLVKLIRLLLR
jgi:hypothetical protein